MKLVEIYLYTAVLLMAQGKYESVPFQLCTQFSSTFVEFLQINLETIKLCSWQNETLDMEHIVNVRPFVNLSSLASYFGEPISL